MLHTIPVLYEKVFKWLTKWLMFVFLEKLFTITVKKHSQDMFCTSFPRDSLISLFWIWFMAIQENLPCLIKGLLIKPSAVSSCVFIVLQIQNEQHHRFLLHPNINSTPKYIIANVAYYPPCVPSLFLKMIYGQKSTHVISLIWVFHGKCYYRTLL